MRISTKYFHLSAFRIVFFAVLLGSLSIAFSTSARAEDERKPLFHFGLFGGLNLNLHIANIDSLSNHPACITCKNSFGSASGVGFSFGALFEFELKKAITLDVRAGFSSLGLKMTKIENAGNVLVRDASNPSVTKTVNLELEHSLESTVYSLGIEPTVGFATAENLMLYTGLRFGYIITARYDYNESISSPDNVTYLNGSVVNNTGKDLDIPNKQAFQVAGIFGVGYKIPIAKNTYVEPEVRYELPFTDISSSIDWKISSLRLGAAIKVPLYPPREKKILEEKIIKRDTNVIAVVGLKNELITLIDSKTKNEEIDEGETLIKRTTITEQYKREIPKAARLAASIAAYGITRNGEREENPRMIIEEIEMEESFPILPQVFFEKNSDELSSKKQVLLEKNQTVAFNEDMLKWNVFDVYNNTLNIIGHRLSARKNAKITLIGCNDNTDDEYKNTGLSKSRAESIKAYFENVWGIESGRISIKTQNLPDNPGNSDIPDGQEENRRVDITSNDPAILDVVSLRNIQRTSNPPTVELVPTVDSEMGLEKALITIEQRGTNLRSYSSANASKQVWNVEEAPMPMFEEPVKIKLLAMDKLAQTTSAEKEISIKQLTIKKKREEMKDDKIIEKYSLIVFDYNSAKLTSAQKKSLAKVKDRIKSNSLVTIAGYADRTGEGDYNRDLAARRIDEVQQVLGVSESNLTVKPYGNDVLLFDNNSPQGRSYSRTVQIIIETPIK